MNIQQKYDLAQRIAQDIPEGSYVNLGIGLPTLVADYFGNKEVILHSENGVLGQWIQAEAGREDWDLINAGKEAIQLKQGGAFFHHADSFGMMRGGHLDYCILGAFQISAQGDLANWHTGQVDAIPAVGGAMDLASGARNVYVMMEHLTKQGQSKILPKCSYPLTGLQCVDRVYTEIATFEFKDNKVYVIDIVAPHTADEVQNMTDVALDFSRVLAKVF
ncbi:3-oxoacid CoA-transferase subunit B [Acinetobacter rudis]|uniref:3-oxoadipate CoA-transferase, beta subunit n=1 Tax=Acinetobacter rudis CIP 110305 TaxID=421052 RepID=S3MX82_9GAMM|nr:3-oxoacid CoA-transferase subunit B [Acinetobacter rudis]EPF71028.1 3-oxoadipate CoA-transferase, beta subunit [Acinetobacter rudis CIP 110305]